MKKTSVIFVLFVSILCLSACATKKLPVLREQGIEAFNQGNYQEALNFFNAALAEGGGEVSDIEFDILKYRAECELRTGDVKKAEDTYRILTELDDSEENEELYAELRAEFERIEAVSEAFSVMESGDYEKAYEVMSEYADLSGGEAGKIAWYNKAVCAEFLGNWEEAKTLMKSYVEAYPGDEDAEKEYAFLKTR